MMGKTFHLKIVFNKPLKIINEEILLFTKRNAKRDLRNFLIDTFLYDGIENFSLKDIDKDFCFEITENLSGCTYQSFFRPKVPINFVTHKILSIERIDTEFYCLVEIFNNNLNIDLEKTILRPVYTYNNNFSIVTFDLDFI